MPEEEKKKKKKFKPVIEEIVPEDEQQSSIETEQQTQEIPQEQPEAEESKIEHPVHTYPTNDESLKVSSIDKPKSESKGGFKLNLSFFFIMIAVAIFVAVVSGALYVYFNGVTSLKMVGVEATPQATYPPTNTPLPTTVATPVPSVSPVAVNTYSVSVLNGSGKAGEAGRAKALLEKAGFKVSRATNADSFDFEQTIVQAKASVSAEVIAKAIDSLKPTYTAVKSDALSPQSSYDIIVTVGAK